MLTVLSYIISLGVLVCFILVVVKMFQSGNTGLGILTIVLAFCGVGLLVAFIWGWIKSGQLGLQKIMLVWTVLIVLNIALTIISPPVFDFKMLQGGP